MWKCCHSYIRKMTKLVFPWLLISLIQNILEDVSTISWKINHIKKAQNIIIYCIIFLTVKIICFHCIICGIDIIFSFFIIIIILRLWSCATEEFVYYYLWLFWLKLHFSWVQQSSFHLVVISVWNWILLML